jgi:DNA-binding NarL/FixJ family response regulator
MVTLAVVDEHTLFRAALCSLLGNEVDLRVVGEAGDAYAAYTTIGRTEPEVVLMESGLCDADGSRLSGQIVRRFPETKILALSMHTDIRRIAQAFEDGVLGYATKVQTQSELVEAIHEVAQGRRYLAPGFSMAAVDKCRPRSGGDEWMNIHSLTPREREVFDLTVRGTSSDGIAGSLGITRRTVETHRSHILRKMKARNSMDLVRFAVRAGLLAA